MREMRQNKRSIFISSSSSPALLFAIGAGLFVMAGCGVADETESERGTALPRLLRRFRRFSGTSPRPGCEGRVEAETERPIFTPPADNRKARQSLSDTFPRTACHSPTQIRRQERCDHRIKEAA
ncbi:hypothetical protein AAFF_G00195460 [Aldrovandia affinis]|uniref:Uncharacterized protein n=1 Tax=Aldrovandia affinis TaxID=143900 RepID=A0AAD7W5H0_9TELE|nr:hypothetical protein AAFF_G00195460 [Aldrovandia affinis]